MYWRTVGIALTVVLPMFSEAAQVMETERLLVADLGTCQLQPIDSAAWVWHKDASAEFVRMRCPFRADRSGMLIVDVTADERFALFLDGREICRGPHKGMTSRWFYTTHEIEMHEGEHLMEAVVWHVGSAAPISQLSYRPGFAMKARGELDAALTTGKGPWTAARLHGTRFLNRWWWTGGAVECDGTSFLFEMPSPADFSPVAVVRKPLREKRRTGGRPDGWRLFPAVLPDQMRRYCAPGKFMASCPVEKGAVRPYAAEDEGGELCAEMNALLKEAKSVVFPPGFHRRFLWDLGDYYCAWPRLETAGGKGSEIRWDWHESLVGQDCRKGNRNAFVGKMRPKDSRGLAVFRPDGRERGVMELPWWRSGRWCEIEVKTGDEPLELTSIGLFETRYPADVESSFACDDTTLDAVGRICVRGLQTCMHETFVDCPYYEQQMYPGDTRIEMLAAGMLNSDDRLVRNCLALFDCARRDDGMLPMNWPTRQQQESATYTLMWPLALADFAMWRENQSWLRVRIPGLRHTMSGFLMYENGDGLLVGLPGWCFADWVNEWKNGVAPDGEDAKRPCAFNNCLYLAALRSAVLVESAVGSRSAADELRAKADRLANSIVRMFWCEEKGLVADTIDKTQFSEHVQCLALIYDVLPEVMRGRCFENLVRGDGMSRASVYFSHYLFETYFKFGRADLFLNRLDLWRDYARLGLKTPLESPGDSARSDCHAWGAHPLFHFHAGLLGVRPAEPGFKSVRISPCPGPLRKIEAVTPHPKGMIECSLQFHDGIVSGKVSLPNTVHGVFEWQGRAVSLSPGLNDISDLSKEEKRP